MFKIDWDFKIMGQTQQMISPYTFKLAEGNSAEKLVVVNTERTRMEILSQRVSADYSAKD